MLKAKFRKTAPECNPEYTVIKVESEAEAEALISLLPDMHPGWASVGEPGYWGKPAGIELVEVVDA